MIKPLFLLLLILIGVLWFIVCFSGCSGVLIYLYFLGGGTTRQGGPQQIYVYPHRNVLHEL